MQLTVDELGEFCFRNRLPCIQPDFDIIAMPIRAKVDPLILDISEDGTKAYVTRARTGSGLGSWRRRDRTGRTGWLGDTGEDVAGDEGIEQFAGEGE